MPKTISELIQRLAADDADTLAVTVNAIAAFGPAGRVAVPQLIQVLPDCSDAEVDAIAKALRAIGIAPEHQLQAVQAITVEPDIIKANAITEALQQTDEYDEQAAQSLYQFVKSDKGIYGDVHVLTLFRWRYALDDLLEPISKMLKDRKHPLHLAAVKAVADNGHGCSSLLPALNEGLLDFADQDFGDQPVVDRVKYYNTYLAAMHAIGAESIPYLVGLVEHRCNVLGGLLAPGQIAQFGEPAVPFVREQLASATEHTRLRWYMSCYMLGRLAISCVPILRRHREEGKRASADEDINVLIAHIESNDPMTPPG